MPLHPLSCGLRWVRFPERTHRKSAPSKVLTPSELGCCAQNPLKKRWVRFVKTVVCGASFSHKRYCAVAPKAWRRRIALIFHKSRFKGTHVPKPRPTTKCNGPKADASFSKNCSDHTPSEGRCPAKISCYDIQANVASAFPVRTFLTGTASSFWYNSARTVYARPLKATTTGPPLSAILDQGAVVEGPDYLRRFLANLACLAE